MAGLSAKKSPLLFFLLVYGLSIPFWIIETMIDVKGLPLAIPITDILAAFAPLTAASILVYKKEGRMGLKKLFGRIFDVSRITQKGWYMPVVFLPVLLYSLIYLAFHFLGLSLPGQWTISFSSIPLFLGVFLSAR